MKAKLVKESLNDNNVSWPIRDIWNGKVTWKDIEPWMVKSRKTSLPDPGFYSDIKVRNAEELKVYIDQFVDRFGDEGSLRLGEWDFWKIDDNEAFAAGRRKTGDSVDRFYGNSNWTGD